MKPLICKSCKRTHNPTIEQHKDPVLYGENDSDDWNICPSCGGPLTPQEVYEQAPKVKCSRPGCEAIISAADEWCPYCGSETMYNPLTSWHDW